MNHIAAIVLAAGKGSRMKSKTTNKVTLKIMKRPLIRYTLDTLLSLKLDQIIVVVGFAKESVKNVLGNRVEYATQRHLLGTGHAVLQAIPHLKTPITTVLSLYGDDSAFYPPALIKSLLKTHHEQNAALTFVTIIKDNPTGLGRIVRDGTGAVMAIVEEKNATPAQKRIKEINTGLYCFDRPFLEQALPQITKNPVSGEYYLTDVVEIARAQGKPIHTVTWPDTSVWHGVNTPEELEAARAKMSHPLEV